jgi:aryl-alcohol dehydrogenase-like predicted oxidoreductase
MNRSFSLGDHELTRIGLGTNRLSATPADRSFLEEAVEAGIEFIDTAHLYTDGESEATIGATLSPYPEGLVVATKGGYESGGNVARLRDELERSFERLRTDSITLYYLHRVHPDTPLEEAMELLAGYLQEGRIEHVGLSEVSVEQIERARAVVPISAVQNEYSVSQRMHEAVLRHCEAEGIAFVSFYPLKKGEDPPRLREVAEAHDATPSQIRLAWLLGQGHQVVPIPGTRSIEHLEENLGALELELSAAELEALSAG